MNIIDQTIDYVRKTLISITYVVGIFISNIPFILRSGINNINPKRSVWIKKYKQKLTTNFPNAVWFDKWPNEMDVKHIGKYSYADKIMVTDFSKFTEIYIGNFVSIAPGLQIIKRDDHDKHLVSTHPKFSQHKTSLRKQKLIIGNDVWIGKNVVILIGEGKSIRIGTGSVIGANAVITKDIADYGIYVGLPARLIGYRFDKKTREALLKIKWWNWSENKINKNTKYFSNPSKFMSRFLNKK